MRMTASRRGAPAYLRYAVAMTSLPKSLAQLAGPSAIRPLWNFLKALPGGGRMMGRLIGRMAPYTGTIKAEVVELEHGRCRIAMKDRPSLRNHLRSVHAIALMNLGEMVTGVAMLATLPEGIRGIPVHLGMDYVKKARGTITGECDCSALPDVTASRELEIEGVLKDEAGDVVARIKARWKVGPQT